MIGIRLYDWYMIQMLEEYMCIDKAHTYIYIHDYMITYVCMVGRLRSFGDGIFSGANIQLQVSTLQGTITYPPVRHF